MTTRDIIGAIDEELRRLHAARAILETFPSSFTSTRNPSGSPDTDAGSRRHKRSMSAETKAKMAEAQKKRWAEKKQA